MSARLQSLIVSYCTALPTDVEALARILSAEAGSPGEIVLANLAEALQRVHRLRGAGGSLGFEAVSRAAAELETHLRAVNAAGGTGADCREDVAAAIDSLGRLRRLAATVKPEGSSLYGIDLSQMALRVGGMAGRR
jgi:HPt (histidine-containing phosphotransfer) domain-containing protein